MDASPSRCRVSHGATYDFRVVARDYQNNITKAGPRRISVPVDDGDTLSSGFTGTWGTGLGHGGDFLTTLHTS